MDKDEVVVKMMDKIRELGLPEEYLDDAVHDAASQQASNVNNEGHEAQIRFLLGQGYGEQDLVNLLENEVEK
jgi:hypothetical protein